MFNVIEQSTSGKQFDLANFATDVISGFVSGAVAGLCPASAGFVKTALYNAAGAIAGDFVEDGQINLSSKDFWSNVAISSSASVVGKWFGCARIFKKSTNLLGMSAKKQSATINSLLIKKKAFPAELGHNSFGNWSVNLFKPKSLKQIYHILDEIFETSTFAYTSVLSSMFSKWTSLSLEI